MKFPVGRLVTVASAILVSCSVVIAQPQEAPPDSLYRIEAFAEFGPMASVFIRDRPVPENANALTAGYNMMIRLKWHPDHLLSIGLMTGYQQIVSEAYTVRKGTTDYPVRARLTAVPVMADVSIQKYGLELGASLGFYKFSSVLTDGGTAYAWRWEVATVYHGALYVPLNERLSIGAEMLISYASYRGIMSIAPQVIFKYELGSY